MNFREPKKRFLRASLLFEKGLALLGKDRYAASEKLFSSSLRIFPNWHQALQRRGFARLMQNKMIQAANDYRRALKFDASCVECWVDLADVYSELGKHKKVVQCLNKTLKLASNDPQAFLQRGEAHLALGNYKAAVSDFERVRTHGGNRFGLLWREGRGRAYALLGEFEKAISDLSQCVIMRPDAAETWIYRGLARILATDLSGGVADLRSASNRKENRDLVVVARNVLRRIEGKERTRVRLISKLLMQGLA